MGEAKARLTIAIAKGRLQDDAVNLLARTGITVNEAALRSRRLAIEDESRLFRFIFVKPSDVPVYVEYGIADCGIVGRDVLLESGANLLQPLDLKIGKCRLVVAALRQDMLSDSVGVLRVATKYPRITAGYFGARGLPIDLITLSGSVELAPILGLSDCIVDLVETGRTLEENGLIIIEEVFVSTARLVINRASYQLKTPVITELINSLDKGGLGND